MSRVRKPAHARIAHAPILAMCGAPTGAATWRMACFLIHENRQQKFGALKHMHKSGIAVKSGRQKFPYRVMVVDDDRVLLDSMVAILADEFDVVQCSSAQEALRTLQTESVHVVCSDWQMPGMDGVEFFRQMTLLWPSIGCILVTGHFEELAKKVEWADRKTLGILRKPFDPQQFLDRVSQFAHLAQMKRSIQNLNAITRGGTRSV